MGETTGIAWTDSTFNPWWGCTKVSPGCDHCYAETLDKRWGDPHWGKGVPRRVFGDKHWSEPLKWDRDAEAAGEIRKVFCASMADVMDDEAPVGQRERLWELIDNTPHLIWQLLTKRPLRYERYLPKKWFKNNNVWLGTSVENQEFYKIRWSILRRITAELNCIAWISYEPALGPLTIHDPNFNNPTNRRHWRFPDWIICGGETGPGFRPMKQEWAEKLQLECHYNEVSFFMKQMSARTPEEGARLIPPHLMEREFPRED